MTTQVLKVKDNKRAQSKPVSLGSWIRDYRQIITEKEKDVSRRGIIYVLTCQRPNGHCIKMKEKAYGTYRHPKTRCAFLTSLQLFWIHFFCLGSGALLPIRRCRFLVCSPLHARFKLLCSLQQYVSWIAGKGKNLASPLDFFAGGFLRDILFRPYKRNTKTFSASPALLEFRIFWGKVIVNRRCRLVPISGSRSYHRCSGRLVVWRSAVRAKPRTTGRWTPDTQFGRCRLWHRYRTPHFHGL